MTSKFFKISFSIGICKCLLFTVGLRVSCFVKYTLLLMIRLAFLFVILIIFNNVIFGSISCFRSLRSSSILLFLSLSTMHWCQSWHHQYPCLFFYRTFLHFTFLLQLKKKTFEKKWCKKKLENIIMCKLYIINVILLFQTHLSMNIHLNYSEYLLIVITHTHALIHTMKSYLSV